MTENSLGTGSFMRFYRRSFPCETGLTSTDVIAVAEEILITSSTAAYNSYRSQRTSVNNVFLAINALAHSLSFRELVLCAR